MRTLRSSLGISLQYNVFCNGLTTDVVNSFISLKKYPNHNNFDTYYLNIKFMILFLLLLKMSTSTTNCPKYDLKAQETSYFFKPIIACLNWGGGGDRKL